MRCLIRPYNDSAAVPGVPCVSGDGGARVHRSGAGVDNVWIRPLEAATYVDGAAPGTTRGIKSGGTCDRHIARGDVDLPTKA